jgi:hypothetical protein
VDRNRIVEIVERFRDTAQVADAEFPSQGRSSGRQIVHDGG